MMFWQFSLERLAMWPPSHTFGLARLPDLIAKNKLHEAKGSTVARWLYGAAVTCGSRAMGIRDKRSSYI
jgi:hypothetical protein